MCCIYGWVKSWVTNDITHSYVRHHCRLIHMCEMTHRITHSYVRHIWQRTATHCNTLQNTTIHCNTLQNTTIHCNTLQHTAVRHIRHLYVILLTTHSYVWRDSRSVRGTRCSRHSPLHLSNSHASPRFSSPTHTSVMCERKSVAFSSLTLSSWHVRDKVAHQHYLLMW